MEKQYILVTDWDKVDREDWYLSKEGEAREVREYGDNSRIKKARALAKEGNLYEAYIVDALSYCIYYQMDANKVFINDDMDIIMEAESAIIGNDHEKRIEYEF